MDGTTVSIPRPISVKFEVSFTRLAILQSEYSFKVWTSKLIYLI